MSELLKVIMGLISSVVLGYMVGYLAGGKDRHGSYASATELSDVLKKIVDEQEKLICNLEDQNKLEQERTQIIDQLLLQYEADFTQLINENIKLKKKLNSSQGGRKY